LDTTPSASQLVPGQRIRNREGFGYPTFSLWVPAQTWAMQGGCVRCPIFYAHTGVWKDAIPHPSRERRTRGRGAATLNSRNLPQAYFSAKGGARRQREASTRNQASHSRCARQGPGRSTVRTPSHSRRDRRSRRACGGGARWGRLIPGILLP